MDFKYNFFGLFFIILGIVFALFHNRLGDFTTRFREKITEDKYDEGVWKINRIGLLFLGIFFTIFGILVLINKIQLR